MKIDSLHIQNFRGIKDLTLELNDVTILIGENNVGKTTILDAIRLCLTKVRMRGKPVFEPYDIHLKDQSAEPSTSPHLAITLSFNEKYQDEWNKKQKMALRKIVQIDNTAMTQSVIFRVTYGYDETTNLFVQNADFLDENKNELNSPQLIRILQEQVSYHYLAALRDASKHFGLYGHYWKDFLQNSNLSTSKKLEIEQLLRQINEQVIDSHQGFQEAIKHLEVIQEILPGSKQTNAVSVEAVPKRIFDMLTHAQVNIKTSNGTKIPISRHGEGTQSLSVLLLFHAFLNSLKTNSSIIGLEEPEAHLHPGAIRALWKTIKTLSGQIIISTHSGELLSEVSITNVVRLYWDSNNVKARRFSSVNKRFNKTQLEKLDFHIRYSRGELLFSRVWLLVEGETEIILFREIARSLSTPLEHLGISCIEFSQIGIGLFIKLADDLGIRWLVLIDNDGEGEKYKTQIKKLLNGRNLSDVLFVTPEKDIESSLSKNGFKHVYDLQSKRKSKPAMAHIVIKEIALDPAKTPMFLKNIIETLIKMAEEMS